jgi:hypothetical protein
MISVRRMVLVLALVGLVGGGCATSHRAALPTARRIPDSAPERLAGLREANPETRAAAVEERFNAEADKERREEARAAKAERERRVDVVEPAKKPPKK